MCHILSNNNNIITIRIHHDFNNNKEFLTIQRCMRNELQQNANVKLEQYINNNNNSNNKSKWNTNARM